MVYDDRYHVKNTSISIILIDESVLIWRDKNIKTFERGMAVPVELRFFFFTRKIGTAMLWKPHPGLIIGPEQVAYSTK